MTNSRVSVAVEKPSAFSRFLGRQKKYFKDLRSLVTKNNSAPSMPLSTKLGVAARLAWVSAFGIPIDEKTKNFITGYPDPESTFRRVIGLQSLNVFAWPHLVFQILNKMGFAFIDHIDRFKQHGWLTTGAKVALFSPLILLELVGRGLLVIPEALVAVVTSIVDQVRTRSLTVPQISEEKQALIPEEILIHREEDETILGNREEDGALLIEKDGLRLVKKDNVFFPCKGNETDPLLKGFPSKGFPSQFSPIYLSTGNILKRIGDDSVEIDEKANLDSEVDQKKTNDEVLIGEQDEQLTGALSKTSNYGSFDDSAAILMNKEGVDEKTNDEGEKDDVIGEQDDQLSASLVGETGEIDLNEASTSNIRRIPSAVSNAVKNIMSFFSPPQSQYQYQNLEQSKHLSSPPRSFRRSGSD